MPAWHFLRRRIPRPDSQLPQKMPRHAAWRGTFLCCITNPLSGNGCQIGATRNACVARRKANHIRAWSSLECPPGSRRRGRSGSRRPRLSRRGNGLGRGEGRRGIARKRGQAPRRLGASPLFRALQALADEVAGEDLAAFLAGMRTGESRELRCENGAFEIVRDR